MSRICTTLPVAVLAALAACAEPAGTPAEGAGAGAVPSRGGIIELQRRAYADNALMNFEEAESLYRESALRSGEAFEAGSIAQLEQELYLALNKSNLGEYQPAEELFAGVLPRIAATGNPVTRLKGRVFQAQHRLNRGEREAALAAAEAAIAEGRAALERGAVVETPQGDTAFVAGPAGLEIPPATARLLSGTPTETAAAALNTHQLTPAEQIRVLIAQAEYVAASAELGLAGADTAGRLARARALMEGIPETTALWLRAETARFAADIALAGGNLDRASAESNEAVRIARRFGAGERPEALLRLQQGRIRLEEGRRSAARESYRRALAILARGGRGVAFDALAPYLALLAEEPPSAARDAEIFLALQQLRNPATSDTLARLAARLSAGSGAAAEAIRALQDSERAVNQAAARLDALAAQSPRDPNAIRITRAEFAAAEAAQAAAREAVAREAPNYGQILDRSVTLPEVQAVLRPGELFLQLRLGQSGGAVAAITRDGLRFAPLAIAEPEAAALVGRVRESVYSPFFDVEAARALYLALIEPVAAEVAAAEEVIVAPDGPLLSIPPGLMIAAEPTGYAGQSLDYSRVPWFATEKAVSVTLSLASFHQLRQVAPSAAPEPFLGFGAFEPFGPARAGLVRERRAAPAACLPVLAQLGDLAPLPGTAEEVRRLAAIAGARGAGQRARILHFATHGLLPLSAECLPEPSLATSLGGSGDGLLEAGEIVGLGLDADLVVLSACDTGGQGATSALGTGFRGTGGEALGGLVRAFFYAGARNVVASHWLVPDAETVALMERLYGGLARGESGAIAMREARRALARDPVTSHPYYWASFSIIGDAGREGRIAAAPARGRSARGPGAALP